MGSIASIFGFGESPAEKARKKEKRVAQAAADTRAKAAAVVSERKKSAQASEEGKASAASKLALISTSASGVLDQASTGRRKLFGN